ncbi:signal transduction histidine kinase [Halteromyces radiatus]|uniref:signal transduction histidine kinase n=1 Tax=Halteromyces radiatus TaxID=101107 RepID=UPI0022209C1E|nr:signal transduction histidine kinase [Halteromyces radiatus]KAI8089654.1 signal transduction histidine kinase [Halteromyces radiatus]
MSAKEPIPTSTPANVTTTTTTTNSTTATEQHSDKSTEGSILQEQSTLKNGEDTDDSKVVNIDDLIDMNTFDQLLDMDDDDDHEFSYSIVLDYFRQAEATFEDMDAALDKENLRELSRLGHFLKGSSAAIGLKKVKATCEKIQNIGNCKDETGSSELNEGDALVQISPLLPQVKAEYSEAEEYLKNFYEVQESR